MTKRPTGGPGSNQYATKPGGVPRRRGVQAESMARALASEEVAAVFGSSWDPSSTVPPRTAEEFARVAVSGTVEQRRRLARRKTAPPELLEWLVENDLDPEVILDAWRQLHPDVNVFGKTANQAAGQPDCPPGLLDRLAGCDDEWLVSDVARNPATLVEVLERLTRDERSGVRGAVAENPNLPARLLVVLAEDEYAASYVSTNPSTPPDVLVRLAQHSDRGVRWGAAINPHTPPEALAGIVRWEATTSLDRSGIDQTKRGVYANPACPPAVLAVAHDNRSNLDWEARAAIASNPTAPPVMLDCYSRDPSMAVRRIVAENPTTPSEIVARLVDDKKPEVGFAAVRNPNCPPGILETCATDPRLSVAVAANPACPSEILAGFYASEDRMVRDGLAANPSTPPVTLRRLSVDRAVTVRASVTLNPSTSRSVLELLTRDPDSGIARAAFLVLRERGET